MKDVDYEEIIIDKVKDYVSEQKALREEAQKLSLIDLRDYSSRCFELLSKNRFKAEESAILDNVCKFVSDTKDRRLQEQVYIYGQLVFRNITSGKPEEKSQLMLRLFEKAVDDYKVHKKEKAVLVQMAEKQEKNFLLTAIISVLIIGGFIILITLFLLGFFN